MLFLGMLRDYIQPSVEIFNIRIDEPVTTATDLLLAAICFFAYYRIRQQETMGRVKWYFKYYFLTLGLGAMFGGLFGHAFLYRLSPEWKLVSWVLTLISVAFIAHALLEVAKPLVKPRITRLIIRFNLLVLAVAVFYTLWTLAFSPVKYYTLFGMVVVVGSLSYFIYQRTSCRGVIKLMGAVAVGLLSALIFSYELGVSPWFNHNDISHVILSYSAFSMYRGAEVILNS
jgi:hypothetical protein